MLMSSMSGRARQSALIWAQVRASAPDAYMSACSLRDVRRSLAAERRRLLIRPVTDAQASVRWRRLGLLILAIDAHTRPGAGRRALLEI